MEKWEFQPIGVVHSPHKYRFETPRQGAFSVSGGEIELFSCFGGDAIADLAGFERIWVIFCFHLNQQHRWKSKVRPPFPASGPCRSVFATRSPYRFNPIGLSCVELAGISGNRLLLRHIDMLDGTPVLDIKPYIPEADAFPNSAVGWRSEIPALPELQWELIFSERFIAQADFILREGGVDLANFARVQLANEPLDDSRKRVKQLDENCWQLNCRTWKMIFVPDAAARRVEVLEVLSNYTAEELFPGADDRYQDKELHRKFNRAMMTGKCEHGIGVFQ